MLVLGPNMHGKCEWLSFFMSKVQEREDTVTESYLKSILSKKNKKSFKSNLPNSYKEWPRLETGT